MNSKLVTEFDRLVSYLKNETDTSKDTQNKFRLKTLLVVLGILKKYPTNITLNNYMDLKELPGIGKGSLDRIKEILETGSLKELGNYIDTKKDAVNELEEIVGIGRSHAIELYNQGVTSVEVLKQKIASKEITVNDKILLGLKYYGKYFTNIPRSEMDEYYNFFKRLIKKINKTLELGDKNEYIFEICGSYRREKIESNDIDVLISKKDVFTGDIKLNHLERIINKLKSNLKSNNNKPLLVDSMTDKKIKTKYMGFSKLLDYKIRRIDIRFIPYDSYYSGLLYFTGSGDFNKLMRRNAIEYGYKLSEYGLFDRDGKMIPVKSEREIFKLLDMEYKPPRLR